MSEGDDERYPIGSRMRFVYRCDTSDTSAHVEWRNRTEQIVTIVGYTSQEPWLATSTLQARLDAAMPWLYEVRWPDGFEGEVFEDELVPSEIRQDGTPRPGLSEGRPLRGSVP